MKISIKTTLVLLAIQSLNIALFTAIVRAQEEPVAQMSSSNNKQEESLYLNTYEQKLKRWQSLSETERDLIRKKAKNISPEKIKELKKKATQFRSLPGEEQVKMKSRHQRFKELPQERRNILKEKSERSQRILQGRETRPSRRFIEKREVFSKERVLPSATKDVQNHRAQDKDTIGRAKQTIQQTHKERIGSNNDGRIDNRKRDIIKERSDKIKDRIDRDKYPDNRREKTRYRQEHKKDRSFRPYKENRPRNRRSGGGRRSHRR